MKFFETHKTKKVSLDLYYDQHDIGVTDHITKFKALQCSGMPRVNP